MKSDRFNDLVEQFKQKHFCVIGDLMLDSYMWGKAHRISQEAPVPVVEVEKVTQNPGGAANVGWNIASLDAKVTMLGVLGQDEPGRQLISIMNERNIDADFILKNDAVKTTVKTRIIAQGQQVVRADQESTQSPSRKIYRRLRNSLQKLIKSTDGVIIADYNKGLLSKEFIVEILKICRQNHVPVYVDPKKDHFFEYKKVRLFKPNSLEFSQAMGSNDIEHQIDKMRALLQAEMIMVTRGADGIILSTQKTNEKIFTKARAVHDVSGAGDTVIAVFALADVSGATPKESAILSNLAAGRVCEEVGVVPITHLMLSEILNHHY